MSDAERTLDDETEEHLRAELSGARPDEFVDYTAIIRRLTTPNDASASEPTPPHQPR